MGRLGLVLAAIVTAAFVTAVPTPASAGVDIAPPEVGSCHDLTYEEALANSDSKAPVECTEPHTALTVAVVQLEAPMDVEAIPTSAFIDCHRATRIALGDRPRSQVMAAYETWFYVPTKAQREAGAAWLRCDLALRGGKHLQPLPTDESPTLKGLPLRKDVARCLLEVRAGAINTVCSRTHDHRAALPLLNRGPRYPGEKTIRERTAKRCTAILGSRWSYYYWPTRTGWKAGYRYSVCFKPNSSSRLAPSSAPGPLVGKLGVLGDPAVHGDRSGR